MSATATGSSGRPAATRSPSASCSARSPELHSLVAAVPAYTEGWREAPWLPVGVLSATLDLQAFSVSPASMLFPTDTDIYLVDRMGKRVPEIPFSDSDVNASAIDALLTFAKRGPAANPSASWRALNSRLHDRCCRSPTDRTLPGSGAAA